MCDCQKVNLTPVAKSDAVEVKRCPCGKYVIVTNQEERPASETEAALADMITSLVRLKLPTSRQYY